MAAARALALRELMLQEAGRRGLVPEPAEVEPGQWETQDEALVRQLLDEGIEIEAFDDGQLRALYDADQDRFRGPSLYEAAHILFPAPAGDASARTAARARAGAVLATLMERPSRFAALAREHSGCSSRDNGGLLGQLASGDTVADFEAALAAMKEGDISTVPVETRYGFHLIRLDAKAHGEVLPFEAVLPHLRAAQEKAAWIHASKSFIAKLVASADITGVQIIRSIATT